MLNSTKQCLLFQSIKCKVHVYLCAYKYINFYLLILVYEYLLNRFRNVCRFPLNNVIFFISLFEIRWWQVNVLARRARRKPPLPESSDMRARLNGIFWNHSLNNDCWHCRKNLCIMNESAIQVYIFILKIQIQLY